jgi:type II secretory pathway pseudopilin PulG
MTLVECLIALALLSLATVLVTAALASARASGERLLAQRRALRAAENALEAVRGGALPLVSGPVEAEALVGDAGEWRLAVRVVVDGAEQPGLYRVAAEAAFEVRGRPGSRRLETLVWRP